MFRYHLFLNNELIAQLEMLPDVAIETLEPGTYIFSSERNRWFCITGSCSPYNDHAVDPADVPKELRMLCLIYNITPSNKPH